MNRFTKSPYPDPTAGMAYCRWGTMRKHWSTQGLHESNGSAIRAARYRRWYDNGYIRTKPVKHMDYHRFNRLDFRAFIKLDLVRCRKGWKIINTRTAYLYWRDFGE